MEYKPKKSIKTSHNQFTSTNHTILLEIAASYYGTKMKIWYKIIVNCKLLHVLSKFEL